MPTSLEWRVEATKDFIAWVAQAEYWELRQKLHSLPAYDEADAWEETQWHMVADRMLAIRAARRAAG